MAELLIGSGFRVLQAGDGVPGLRVLNAGQIGLTHGRG